MIIANTIAELRKETAKARAAGKRIGFVPTMGYLHEGHLSLVEISKRQSDYQVMSIFVNKIQFNDRKDYDSYPRELERDFAMARAAGVDLMFTPDDGEMYHDQLTFVDVESLTGHLCGAHRPGHFRGVYTVVSKLFNIVQPDVSVFGQKDIQQAATIEKMVADLNFPVKMVIGSVFLGTAFALSLTAFLNYTVEPVRWTLFVLALVGLGLQVILAQIGKRLMCVFLPGK